MFTLQPGDEPDRDCINVTAVQDNLIEGLHTFDIVLTSTDHPNVGVGVDNISTISIFDDEGKQVLYFYAYTAYYVDDVNI